MKTFVLNRNGVSTIEFTFTIGIYLFVVFMIFELARMVLVSAYWDSSIAESVRRARANQLNSVESNYTAAFLNELKNQKILQDSSPMGMFMLTSKNSLPIVDVKYVDCNQGLNKSCVDALINGYFRDPNQFANNPDLIGKGQVLAVYDLKYQYEFSVKMPFLPKSWANNILQRRILSVQEYEK
jgi:tadE